MAKVQFYGGPYDGKEAELPFLPELLIGETMDGKAEMKDGTYHRDLRVSRYIYQLCHPDGENEPFEYRFRLDRPDSLRDWLIDPPKS